MRPAETHQTRADDRQLRFGKRKPDGSVRFVVRPIRWPWVLGGAGLGVAVSALLFIGSDAPWYIAPILLSIPFFMTWHDGFEVRPRQGVIRGWRALGPIPYSLFTHRQLELPAVRSKKETYINNSGMETEVRVTYLAWGSRNLRVGIKRGDLNALLEEAEAVGLTPANGRAGDRR